MRGFTGLCHFTKREWAVIWRAMAHAELTERQARLRKLLIDLAAMGAIGVVLALIGPFGSFREPLALRLIVWVGFAYVGYALYAPIDGLAQRIAPALALPVWALRIAGVLLASAFMSVLVWVLPQLPGTIRVPSLSAAMAHYFYVTVVGGMITALFTLGQRGTGGAPSPPVPVAAAPAPETGPSRFFDRLPVHLGTDLLALEMEDHYVRAHTGLGSELVLMRLGDAIAELDEVEGLQTHRSWWVARDAVEEVKRDGRNLRLVLSSGLEAPVSRNRANDLKAAGWL